MPKKSPSTDQFLAQLQRHAKLQSELNASSILPHHLDWLTAKVGSYPWQTLVSLATISTLMVMVWRQW